MADIAPLGFAIDTGPLLKAQEAAAAVAESLKGVGAAAGQAQQATSGMAQGASSDAQKLNQTAQAAEALAKANEHIAESAAKAQQAQTMLATAPKPTPAATPGAVSPVVIPAAPMPVQAKSGGWYADQATADWADGQAARRAAASAAEQASLQASVVRPSPVAAVGAGVTGNAVAGAVAGAGRGGITGGLDDTAQAAGAATGAVGRATAGISMLGAVAASVGAALLVGLVMVLKGAVESLIATGDETVLLERRLQSITGTSERAARAIDGVRAAAQRSGSQTEDQQVLRTGLERAAMDSSPEDMDLFGSTMSQIDRLGGARAADFDQLGGKIAGAFKDGRVELGELNALLDHSPELAAKLAQGMNQPIEAIQQMAADGRLFSDDFVAGVNRASEATQTEFRNMAATAEGSFTEMGNAAGEFWKELASQSGLNELSAGIAAAITKGFRDAADAMRRGESPIDYSFFTSISPSERNVHNADQANLDRQAQLQRDRQSGADPVARARNLELQQDLRAVLPPNVRMGSGYRTHAEQAQLVRDLPGIAVADSRHPDGLAQDFQIPGMGARDVPRVRDMLRNGGVEFEDVLFHNNHFHVERAPLTGNEPTSEQNNRANTLLTQGGSVQIANLEADLASLNLQPPSERRNRRIAEIENQLRAARAAQSGLGRNPYSNAQDAAADMARARTMGGGGGGTQIISAALRADRAAVQSGYGSNEQGMIDLGISGAVGQSQDQINALDMRGAAEQARTDAAGRGRLAMDNARIAEQTAQFRFQNFGTIQDDKITEATEKYRQALERLTVAQRATANAQSLLNAQNEAGVEAAASAALVAGQRGYAVDLARQQAEEAVLASDGGDVAGARIRFNSRNAGREAAANAESADAMGRAGRYASIGSDAFSRRQFGRMEDARQAAEGSSNPILAMARVASDQANEDARISKDRLDADTESMRVAERQLELQGLVGRSRREALAVMEREEELVAQGLLPAGGKLAEEEERSVRANSERLRLIQQQAQSMEEIASIAANTANAVGGGARSLFADLFEDGKVEAEKFVSVIQGVVSRIGTNIADVLLVRPLERATEQFAEQATDFLQDAVGSMRGGDRSSARGSGAGAAVVEGAKAAAAAAARSTADARAAVVTTGATGAMATLTKSAIAAAAALTNMAGGEATKTVGAAVSRAIKGAAFGDTFGGVGDTPTLFQMAGGMGLAFEAGPEAVLPLKRGPDGRLGVAGGGGGGGEGVAITVIDQRGAGAPVETKETRGPDGKRMISMFIRDEARNAMREGDMDGPMRDNYGLTRQIARR